MLAALIDYLLAHSSITAIAGDRIRPLVRDQGDNPPCIVLTPISGQPQYTLLGGIPFARARVQVDCYAATWPEADDLKRAVKGVLSGRAFTRLGVEFRPVTVIDERSMFEGGEDPTARLYRELTEYRVWHTDP